MKGIGILLGLACLGVAAFAAEEPRPLTLKQARELALQNHPRITAAALKAMVARQATREVQSALYPSLWGNVAAVGAADPNTRIASAGLPVSSVFDRASASINLTQLVTDFGRTSNLKESSKLRAAAEEENADFTRAQLLLQVDAAYYGGLQADAVLHVAEGTIKTRQLLRDQVSLLVSNQLRSELDASFSEVGLQEAQLAQIRARNDLQSSYATLGALLGSQDFSAFKLVDEPLPDLPAAEAQPLIVEALRDRPELKRLRLERDSAYKLARAEHGAYFPTLSIQGSAGVLPLRDRALSQDYAAAGIILSIPLYTGTLYDAREKGALLRAQIAGATLLEEENNVVRDVRIAWLGANNARERLAVTERLLEQARRAQSLAEARYQAGSSSIVELSQAQLNVTSGEITHASARYEFLLRRSILNYQTGKWR